MYYPFIIKYLKSSNGDKDMLEICTIFDDYSVIESLFAFKHIFKLDDKIISNFKNDLVCVFDSDSNILSIADKSLFEENSSSSFHCIQIKTFQLRSRFFRFLLKLIHDCNKTFESMDASVSFLHDYMAGALPADLYRKYSWYRVFGYILNESCDLFHDTNF